MVLDVMVLERIQICLLLVFGCVPGLVTASGTLDWEQRDGHRVARLNVPATGRTGFTLLPSATIGIRFVNALPETRRMANANLMNG